MTATAMPELDVNDPRFNSLLTNPDYIQLPNPPFSGDLARLRWVLYTARVKSVGRYWNKVVGDIAQARSALVVAQREAERERDVNARRMNVLQLTRALARQQHLNAQLERTDPAEGLQAEEEFREVMENLESNLDTVRSSWDAAIASIARYEEEIIEQDRLETLRLVGHLVAEIHVVGDDGEIIKDELGNPRSIDPRAPDLDKYIDLSALEHLVSPATREMIVEEFFERPFSEPRSRLIILSTKGPAPAPSLPRSTSPSGYTA